ncbi:MAG: phosphonate metabolism transcriptional regulator PhnF [Pseudomonadota bacterium]|nr:phosphonate metabolism transcriptional regulator PhnF [Pseudomonadota bacterium]
MTSTLTHSSFPGHDGERFWVRIAQELSQAIASGVYEAGQRLPSESALAAQFGVNRHTIRRSLASLAQQGLLRSEQGSGTYVEDFAVDVMLGRRTRHRQSLAQAGLRGSLQVLDAGRVRASAAQARALRLRPRASVLRLLVLGIGGDRPLHYSERYFPLPRFEGLDEQVRQSGSITEAFRALGVADYTRVESRISAQMPSAETATWLRQPAMRPVLQVSSVNADTGGQPIEFSIAWFAGDRVQLTVMHDEL